MAQTIADVENLAFSESDLMGIHPTIPREKIVLMNLNGNVIISRIATSEFVAEVRTRTGMEFTGPTFFFVWHPGRMLDNLSDFPFRFV